MLEATKHQLLKAMFAHGRLGLSIRKLPYGFCRCRGVLSKPAWGRSQYVNKAQHKILGPRLVLGRCDGGWFDFPSRTFRSGLQPAPCRAIHPHACKGPYPVPEQRKIIPR